MGSTSATGAADRGHQYATMTSPTPNDHLFFVDNSGVVNAEYESYICGLYQRHTDTVFGEEEPDGKKEEPESLNLCFNCGLPDHSVPTCPFRRDKDLISLSRQYYNFYKDLRGVVDHPRIYLAEGWRQQRLEWLEIFQPGQIKSPLLREAIGAGDGDWLRNIATWGYPPGWISVLNPREKVRVRLWDEHIDRGYDYSDKPFYIFGDSNEVEDVVSENTLTTDRTLDVHHENFESVESLSTTRWATYPSTYFSSELLFPYTRQETPPSSSVEWNAVFDGEDDYFAQLYGLPPPPPEGPPPPLPPPPPISPPPLPSNPPTLSPPTPLNPEETAIVIIEEDEDMEISDSE